MLCCLALLVSMFSCGSSEGDLGGDEGNNDQGNADNDNGAGTGDETLGVWEEKELSAPALSDVSTKTVTGVTEYGEEYELTLHTTPIQIDKDGLKAKLESIPFIQNNYYLGEILDETAESRYTTEFNFTYEYSVVGQLKEGYTVQTDTYYSQFAVKVYYNPLVYTNSYRIEITFDASPISTFTQSNHMFVLKELVGESVAEFLVKGKNQGGAFPGRDCGQFEMYQTAEVGVATYFFSRYMDTHYMDNHKKITYSFGVKSLTTPEPSSYIVYNGDYASVYPSFPRKLTDVVAPTVTASDPFEIDFLKECIDVSGDYTLPAHDSRKLHTLTKFICKDYEIYSARFYTPRCEISYSLTMQNNKVVDANLFCEAPTGEMNGATREDAFNLLKQTLNLSTNNALASLTFADLKFNEEGQSEAYNGSMTLFGMPLGTEVEFYLYDYEGTISGSYRMWARS